MTKRVSWIALGLFTLVAPIAAGCTAETSSGEDVEATEDDLTVSTAGCTAANLQTAKTAWSKAYQLARPLSATATNDRAKLDAVGAQIDAAITACPAFATYAYDPSYKSVYAQQVRASGGTLAYAVRFVKNGDECTDRATVANAVYATTSANAAFQKVVRSDAWTAPVRDLLAGHLVRSELDGSSTFKTSSTTTDITQEFGDLPSVKFRAPRPGVLPVLELTIFKNGSYEEVTTNSDAEVVTAKGTWKNAGGGKITFTPAKGAATTGTLIRETNKNGAPIFKVKFNSTELSNYDLDLCSA